MALTLALRRYLLVSFALRAFSKRSAHLASWSGRMLSQLLTRLILTWRMFDPSMSHWNKNVRPYRVAVTNRQSPAPPSITKLRLIIVSIFCPLIAPMITHSAGQARTCFSGLYLRESAWCRSQYGDPHACSALQNNHGRPMVIGHRHPLSVITSASCPNAVWASVPDVHQLGHPQRQWWLRLPLRPLAGRICSTPGVDKQN